MKVQKKERKRFLLVNPWIIDFAAYDLWARPLALLYLASLLRDAGHGVTLINCLDHRVSTGALNKHSRPVRKKYGTGKYIRTEISKPEVLNFVLRKYCRYGMPPDNFKDKLRNIPQPDVILITSLMTYWYPGISETTRMLREIFPETVMILGGNYVRLCFQHAIKMPGVDFLYPGTLADFPDFLMKKCGIAVNNKKKWENFTAYPYPAYDLWEPKPLEAVAIMTSEGCPFRCPYCASSILHPQFSRRHPEDVYREIVFWHEQFGVEDFAFYDDALLLDSRNHIIPILEKILEAGLRARFHTPNAVHVKELSLELCEILKAAGFTTLRLGLETASIQRSVQRDNKVQQGQFPWAMKNLKKAGFSPYQLGVYLLCGLPYQEPSEVEYSIDVVRELGGWPYLAEYSPIPHTEMWKDAVKVSPFPLETEPLFQNNTLFPCRSKLFPLSELERLKRLAREARK